MGLDNKTAVDAVIEQTTLDPNRPATKEDALTLGSIWASLTAATRNAKTALRNLQLIQAASGYSLKAVDEYVREFDATQSNLKTVLIDSRNMIESLPAGVTAPGGATRQSVVMEFYGSVTKSLGAHMTVADARRINKASFTLPR